MKKFTFALCLAVLLCGTLNALTVTKNINIPKEISGKVSFLGVQQNFIDTVNNSQKNENIDHAINIIKTNPGYDLYVLPELSVTGYSKETFENLNILAEPPDSSSKSFKRFSEIASEINAYIIFSVPTYFHEKGSNIKRYHISAFVVSPKGKLDTVYNKNYLFTMEQNYFETGWRTDVKNSITVIDINNVKLGLAICYDMRYPELWREMSMKYDVAAYIQILCTGKDFSFNSWRTIATARSIENEAYVLSLNRSGSNYGNSMFIQPGTPDVSGYEITPTYCTLNNNEGVIGGVISQKTIDEIRKQVTILKDGKSLFPKYKTLK